MRRSASLPFLALAAGAAIALTGCTALTPGATELDPMKSPLSEYMNAIYGQYDQEYYDAQQKQTEELVAACMSKEGFEYIPVDYSGTVITDDGEDRDTEEWVAANGYGYFQTPEQIAEQQEQSEEYVDPNQDYVTSLSDTEQTAYYETLYGPGPTEEEMSEDGSYEYNWETAGCQGAAQHEVQGEQVWDDERYKPLLDSMNTIYEKVQSDPETVKVNAEWSSCMADAGHPDLKTKDGVWEVMNAKSEEVYGSGETGPTDEALAQAREEEIELALADFHCTKDVDYQNRTLTIQFDLEKQFIADNKAELDAMLADYQQGE